MINKYRAEAGELDITLGSLFDSFCCEDIKDIKLKYRLQIEETLKQVKAQCSPDCYSFYRHVYCVLRGE
jgi:hypothetical protein